MIIIKITITQAEIYITLLSILAFSFESVSYIISDLQCSSVVELKPNEIR